MDDQLAELKKLKGFIFMADSDVSALHKELGREKFMEVAKKALEKSGKEGGLTAESKTKIQDMAKR